MDKWEKSRLKYWLDIISDITLIWCSAAVVAIVLGIDIGVWL